MLQVNTCNHVFLEETRFVIFKTSNYIIARPSNIFKRTNMLHTNSIFSEDIVICIKCLFSTTHDVNDWKI